MVKGYDVFDCMDARGRATQEYLPRMHKCRVRQEVESGKQGTAQSASKNVDLFKLVKDHSIMPGWRNW